MIDDFEDGGTCLCAADKLPIGRFRLKIEVTISNREVVLEGDAFDVR